LATFEGNNGLGPTAGLILSDGILYGTTADGGANNDGTVFSLAIPEPTSLSLLALGGIGLLARQRRRRITRN
jgi:uncharacterized repeat protein (TIGR03803 family)